MIGFTSQTHTRTADGTTYTAVLWQHERGISIVVTVPGIGPEEENDCTYASIDAALAAGDEIARSLIRQQGPKR